MFTEDALQARLLSASERSLGRYLSEVKRAGRLVPSNDPHQGDGGSTRRPLELLQMTPEDIERGELVYTLPLAPKEKVTISSVSATPFSLKFSRKSCTVLGELRLVDGHSLCEIDLRQPRHHVVDRVWSWTSLN